MSVDWSDLKELKFNYETPQNVGDEMHCWDSFVEFHNFDLEYPPNITYHAPPKKKRFPDLFILGSPQIGGIFSNISATIPTE